MSQSPKTHPRQSTLFDPYTNSEIRRAAETGIYDIRGGGSKRRLPHFDDLLFLGASISRYPLEGYRESCNTKVTIGDKNAKNKNCYGEMKFIHDIYCIYIVYIQSFSKITNEFD